MFDTIRFCDRHPEVEAGSEFHQRARAGRTRSGDDRRVLLVQASNGSLVRLRRGHVWSDGPVAVNVSGYGVYITTSAARDPRTPTAPNVEPPRSPEELAERLDITERYLSSIGLRTVLRDCGLSRVDQYRDVALDAAYGDLLPALEARDLQRLSPADLKAIAPFDGGPGSQSKKPLDEHTYGRTWQEHALVIYSKSAHVAGERRHREYASEVVARLQGRSVVRVEQRCTKKRTVRSKLGIERGADLITSWGALETTFANTMVDALGEPADMQGSSGSATTVLEELAGSGFGRGQKLVLADLALSGMEYQFQAGTLDIEGLRARLAAVGVRKGEIDKVLDSLLPHVKKEDGGAVVEAIDELRTKLKEESYVWPSPDVGAGGRR